MSSVKNRAVEKEADEIDLGRLVGELIDQFNRRSSRKINIRLSASLAGAEFTWKYYAGFYNKDNLPAEATRTWVTKTIAETPGKYPPQGER